MTTSPSLETATPGELPAELLRALVRFDTTNPPGAERACIEHIDRLLTRAGFETELLGADPERPNLLTRLPGTGDAPPLLLYGHVDVVTTAGQDWTHPPFEGRIEGGYLWGRGALDMKGGVAMLLGALLRARRQGLRPAGDLLLAVLSDEEAGGDLGARYLVEHHPERFEGVRWALGEFGGFSFHVGGRRFYPIQVTEKQLCWMKATLKGPGGHGSQPFRGGAMARLGRLLTRLDRGRLPVHPTPVVVRMLEEMGEVLGTPARALLSAIRRPALAGPAMALLGPAGTIFEALLRNTVNATLVWGGDKVNVIPSRIEVELDGRLLPGYGPETMLAEVEALLRGGPGGLRVGDGPEDEVELEVLRYEPAPAEPDWSLYDFLAGLLREADPEGVPVPLVLSGVTDGRIFSRLGIQTYGFLPMKLPADFRFVDTIHAADERIPLDALEFGTDAIFRALERYGR